MPELWNVCLKTNQLLCAEGLFWELRYQHENKGFKTQGRYYWGGGGPGGPRPPQYSENY